MEHASGITSSITPLALIERAATKKTSAKRLTVPLYHFARQAAAVAETSPQLGRTIARNMLFTTVRSSSSSIGAHSRQLDTRNRGVDHAKVATIVRWTRTR